MAGKPTCLVCQKEMVRGFMADLNLGRDANLPRWCQGEPKSGLLKLGEASRSQVSAGLAIVAYRCPECEALRLYAPSAD